MAFRLASSVETPAPIVVYADAPHYVRLAADELAEYIQKTVGVRPPVIEGLPDPAPPSAIWVGYQPVLNTIFPDVDFDFTHPEEILILADAQQVNAVYTFLQDYLDVRWLWPGEMGEDVIQREIIEFKPFIYRYHPQIRHRAGLLAFSSLPGWGYGRSRDWSRRQRLQLDSLEMGGHAFMDWWERFGETHQEYFALLPDGRRAPYGRNVKYIKMCESNPGLWDQWLAEVDARLQDDPNHRVFSAGHNDDWASGYCTCDGCRAWDHPAGELRHFRWPGLSVEYVAISDRHVTFANTLARKLKQRYPDKDYYVVVMAYGHTRPPPVAAVPDDNVIIASVANFYGRPELVDQASTTGMTHRRQFLGWGKVAPNIIWRPNTGSPAGSQQGQPDVFFQQVIDDWKMVAESGCIGIWIDMIWEHWATQGPQYYLMAQLTWNPYQDGWSVLEDYYRRGFGPAADEMRDYWALLNATRELYVSKEQAYHEVYDSEFFVRAGSILDRAAARVPAVPDTYSQRVAFVRVGLEYTRLLMDLRRIMVHARAAKGEDTSALEQARATWSAMEQLCQDNPGTLNWSALRPQTPRMRSLNPDYISAR
ncbi:MAG: DUF4838 domain-containing protein [Lentisphaerae bacterium]|nr:DUF4838 domain-containing protein [Lentisphaerota bacterium]